MGSWLIWLPCAGWLMYQGHWGSAIFLILVGTLVIGTMDNIIRTYVLQSDAKLHPLLAFVSVLGGLQMMGLWGVFIGPIVASCLHALVQIFNAELKAFSKEKFNTRNMLDLVPDEEYDDDAQSKQQESASKSDQETEEQKSDTAAEDDKAKQDKTTDAEKPADNQDQSSPPPSS